MKTPPGNTVHWSGQARTSAWLHSLTIRPSVPAARPQSGFTLAEHLRVQTEIEKRAHHIWLMNDCAPDSTLNNWLKAEAEVMVKFILGRRQPPLPAALGKPHKNTGALLHQSL